MSNQRDSFGSRFGVLVALTGSAVGLGNLWRFPYLVGTNGGAAFIIIYICFALVLCLPIMFSEFVIGRRSQANVFGAFKVLAPKSKWGVVGIIAVLASFSILSFYCVVGGWTIDYIVKAITFKITSASEMEISQMFPQVASATWSPLIYLFIFLGLTGLIVVAGIQKGIERYTKIMMPLLFVMIVIIAVRSLTLPGASEGLKFLFKPDFSKVTSQTFLDALGQAFFSLSLGCGTIMTYASYVKKNENIIKTSSLTAVFDTLFAIIAGTAIMPAVFAFGISPSQGPGLVFVTLPHIFSQMTGGGIIAILFFITLFIAAITSSISLLEVIVAYMKEEFNISRKWSVTISFILILITGSLCSLSQGVLADFKIFGLTFFDIFDKLSANILMPLGGLLVVIFIGWRLGKSAFKAEITNEGALTVKGWLFEVIYFIIKFIAPVIISVIMLTGLF